MILFPFWYFAACLVGMACGVWLMTNQLTHMWRPDLSNFKSQIVESWCIFVRKTVELLKPATMLSR